jgi:acetylornithine deacetylase/succinyl-diaminopimelate desuccinylase-like protein
MFKAWLGKASLPPPSRAPAAAVWTQSGIMSSGCPFVEGEVPSRHGVVRRGRPRPRARRLNRCHCESGIAIDRLSCTAFGDFTGIGHMRSIHRRCAAVASLGLLSAVAAFAANPPAAAPAPALGRDLLKQLIEINTTHAQGSTRAAQVLAERFLAAGFVAEDVTLLAPAEHPTKGNLVVRLRGRGLATPILYLCHLDVVEAKREDWSYDPFLLTEADGWLYGRGTIDMKGQDAAVATALIRLHREGFKPARDVIVAFTADEEAGGDANGVDWLLREHRDRINAGLVVNPDGGEAGMKLGRKLYVAVQTSEKVFVSFRLEATDKGGHSSRPTSGNPIYRLGAALARLAQFRFPTHLTETTQLYFARRAELEAGQLQADMRMVGSGRAEAAAIGRLSAEVETDIMLRTTCTATLIDGGHAENALPQRARAAIQCRVVPGESPELIRAQLQGAIGDPSIAVSTMTEAHPSPESPPATALLAQVEQVVHELWPGVIVVPEMSAGADDSLYTRNAGIASYGIDGMFDDLDDGRAHGRDERIGVAAFADELEFTYRLMKHLALSPSKGAL